MQFGSFVDGLFAGAKSTAELLETKNRLEDQYAKIKFSEDAKKQADLDVKTEAGARDAITGEYYGGGGEIGTTGTSTAPVPTEIKEGVTGTKAVNAGAPELVDKIAPLVSKRESDDRPNVGYGGVDLSKAPAKPGYFGFPDWAGAQGPDGITHAAGLYGFQPDTWKQYAEPLGITDFSPESQRKVFNAAYLAEGMRPWARNRALIGDVAAAGLLGGAATSGARAGAPAAVPSALAGTPAPTTAGGTAAPDTEGQPAKVATGPSPVGSPIAAILKAVAGPGVTPAQQANVPEGFATAPPIDIPRPASAAPVRSSALSPDPVAAAASTSALSPPSTAGSGGSAGAVTVPQTSRPVLAQLRQSDQGGGMGMRPPQGPPPSRPGAPQQFAAGSKVIRLPDGTMVDGVGNIVRPAPSALYPTRTA